MHNAVTMPTDPNALLGAAEAAEVLAINRATLTRWVAAGKITPVLRMPGPSGAMLFDPADVAALARLRATRIARAS